MTMSENKSNTAGPDTAQAQREPDVSEPLLSVKGLTKHFPIYGGFPFKRQVGAVQAVDGVTLDVYPGESLGLVGESGCGKSTTGGSSPG